MITITNVPETGTISHGTLLPDALIPAFRDALEALSPEACERVTNANEGAEGLRMAMLHGLADASDVGMEALDVYVEELTDELNRVVNEKSHGSLYFGAIEGDGSDFGFWRTDTFVTEVLGGAPIHDWLRFGEAIEDEDEAFDNAQHAARENKRYVRVLDPDGTEVARFSPEGHKLQMEDS